MELPGFWSGSIVAAALATCDLPTLMDEIRKARGWSQAELGTAVGYSQSWVSKTLRRETILTLEQARVIIRQLGIPAELIRLADTDDQSKEDPTKRREFGKVAALAFLPASRPAVSDDGKIAQALTGVTGSQRRLDATVRSRDLIGGVTAHLELAVRMHHQAGTPEAPALAAAISEAAGFAAWLSVDMLDLGSARTYYRQAVRAARHAQMPLLAAYMTGSLAAFEIDAADDPLLALAMIAHARELLDQAPAHSMPTAWLESLEALAHASKPRPDETEASRAITRAEQAIDRANEPPPWPWVYPFDHVKLARTRASVAVRLGQSHEAERAFAESLPTSQPAPKQAALTTLEIATAASQRGEVEEAFTLASRALQTGIDYGSERIIQRARQFRYQHSGQTAEYVTQFDDQLRSTLT